jgi:hypothetical protein
MSRSPRSAVSLPNPDDLTAVAAEVFPRVWRTTLDRPGFAVLRFATLLGSRELRRAMLGLVAAFPVRFVPERFGRFDQQVSSKFHRDGAPPASLLVLGYEPTTVRSRIWVADVAAAAAGEGMALGDYLAAFNPMFPAGEAKLGPFITELDPPRGEAFVVVLNNSLLPVGNGNPLGLLHKAVIDGPDPGATRVVNSVGFTPAEPGAGLPAGEVEQFLRRDHLD